MNLPRLLTAELPTIPSHWRRWVLPGMLLFALGYAGTVTVDALFHHTIMLGPGFVDDGHSGLTQAKQTLEQIEQRYPSQGRLLVYLLLPLFALVMVQNAIVIVQGYTQYEKHCGQPYSLQEMALMFALNGIQVLLLFLILLLLGIVCWLLGGDFSRGWHAVHQLTLWSNAVLDAVPTLVTLPRPLPLIIALLGVDFAYYWLHRWSHTRRLPWLLLHRPHHLTEHLIIPVTQPVFVAAPLFLLVSIPLQVLTGISTKLFNPDPMIVEALVLRVITHAMGIYSHSAPHYDLMQHTGWLRKLSAFCSVGNYHYMHHSSRKEHGLVNLGAVFWMVWDRVFGTYVEPPDTRPPTGLTNNPPLYQNPLRLALAGLLQLGYEWQANPDWRTRWKILSESSHYTPPHSQDFALKLPFTNNQIT